MPLTSKGSEIKSAMIKEYGEKKGEQVFYASENAGKISGIVKRDCDEMNEGSEGLKTYGDSEEYEQEKHPEDAHHHKFEGDTGPEIEDKRRDAGMGLVQAKEEPEAAHANYPKPMDAKFTHEFPNDPFGDKNPTGGFEYTKLWTASEMKNSPFAIYKE